MKKYIPVVVIAGIILGSGCASREMRNVENATSTNQNILRENEHRLQELEQSVTALNSQIAQLNNRVYEVRTRTGQKTSMRVVPVSGVQPGAQAQAAPAPATPAPAAVAQTKSAPKGRVINPKNKPTPLQAAATPPAKTERKPAATSQVASAAGARGRIGQPEIPAAPGGQNPSASQPAELALPPTDISTGDQGTSITAPASSEVAVPTGNAQAIPVPVMPPSDLSLPPEHPDLAATPQPAPAVQAQPAAQPAVQATRAPSRGEEAAYKAALNAARSGHTAESIRMFRNFLQQYPNGRYAANADYWIGECLYAEGKYKDALSQFQTVNNSYPSHHKNADALLKAAITLNRLGDKAGADQKFKTLLANFPNSDAARRARAMGAR